MLLHQKKILFYTCFVLFLRGLESLKNCRTGSDSHFLLLEKTHQYCIYLEKQTVSPCALSQITSWPAWSMKENSQEWSKTPSADNGLTSLGEILLMQWLILIASFLGKCDFINYYKCTMFANTVPWEQGMIYDKCWGRPIADEMCCAGSIQSLSQTGMHVRSATAVWLCGMEPFEISPDTNACSRRE